MGVTNLIHVVLTSGVMTVATVELKTADKESRSG